MAHAQHEQCSPRSPSLKEGIDDDQQEEIDEIFKNRRGISSSEKVRLQVEKWFDAWRFLFPGVKEPSHPCKKEFVYHRDTPVRLTIKRE
jgi:hypothetical protein